MRRILIFAIGLALAPGLALAACGGTDLVAALATQDKAAHDALFERAHSVPNGQGVFWRIGKEGVAESHLFGTFPDPELEETAFGPQIQAALGASRLLMVEMTEAEQKRLDERMGSDPAFVINRARSGLTAELTPQEAIQAEAKLVQRGVPMKIVDKLRPPILYSILTVPPCVGDAVQAGGRTLSDAVAAAAAEAGTPVSGLETFERALGSVAAVPSIDVILLAGLRNLGREEDLHRTGAELYRKGEIAAIWEFDTLATAQAVGAEPGNEAMAQLNALMLGTRNLSWSETIAPELAEGGVFVAVGAVHLPGPSGLIEILRGLGYTVTRLDG